MINCDNSTDIPVRGLLLKMAHLWQTSKTNHSLVAIALKPLLPDALSRKVPDNEKNMQPGLIPHSYFYLCGGLTGSSTVPHQYANRVFCLPLDTEFGSTRPSSCLEAAKSLRETTVRSVLPTFVISYRDRCGVTLARNGFQLSLYPFQLEVSPSKQFS